MKNKYTLIILIFLFVVLAFLFYGLEFSNPDMNRDGATGSEAKNYGPSLALTTGGEEVLSFNYEGIGSDVIVRKNRTFIMRVYYGDKSEGKGYSWEVPALFQYFKTEGMSDGVDGKIVDPFISASLLFISQAQTRLVLDPQARYPVAGVTPYANIKRVRINGQPVEKVHEYVDEAGHTWYIWYYRDLKLKPTGNKVTLD